MKRILRYLKPYKVESILGPSFKLLEASFELLVPLIVAAIIDLGIAKGDRAFIVNRSLVLLVLGFVGMICAVTAQYFAAKAAVGLGTKLRQALFDHIQGFSLSVSDKIQSAALITRITADVNQVQAGANHVLRLFLRSPFIVFGAMVMAFTIDKQAALIFVVLIPVLALVVGGILVVGIPLFVKVGNCLELVVRRVRENLTGVRVLRAFRHECKEEEGFAADSEGLLKLQLFTGRITGLLNPLTLVIVNIFIIVLLYQGAGQVRAGVLTLGAVVALLNYMSQILVELIKLANLFINAARSFASGKRIIAVFDIEAEDRKMNAKAAVGDGGLTTVSASFPHMAPSDSALPLLIFDNVSFKYPDAADNALDEISFTVNRGETIGIIGGTGAGKTTLINLLSRFYDVTDGYIYYEGVDLQQIESEDIRKQLGLALQKAILFKGTVRENLHWAKPDATDSEIWEALNIAQASDFIRDMDGQLDAMVGQEGRNLSGGQKQRLSIARALIRKPPVLIIDDSTSALDFLTEAALIDALKKISFPVTTFIISQRAGSVRHADRIIVLEDGRMVGCGNHDGLMKECAVYQEILAGFDRHGS